MNKVTFLIVLSVLITSCIKYEEKTYPTLDGEYIIDKVTITATDQSITNIDSTYQPGTMFVNPNENHPMDTIKVGFTEWAFDASQIYMSPYTNQTGTKVWSEKYFYEVHQYGITSNDKGYIQFYINGTKRIFKIIDDGLESLTLRTTGQWPIGNNGPDISITLQLTRVGP
jgi:hypothetical protein